MDSRTQSPIQGNMRWDDACGDSIAAAQLWHRVKSELGEDLPLDLLTTSLTPSELASAISARLAAGTGGSIFDRSAPDLPLAFFMPHAYGEVPYLAEFRSHIRDRIRLVMIQYPQWSEILDGGGGFGRIVDAVEAQVLAESGERDACLLAGFSFCGFVAWETARRLLDAGRRVGFVGLIASVLVPPPPISFRARVDRYFSREWWRWGRLSYAGVVRVANLLERRFPLTVIWKIDRLLLLLPGKLPFSLHLELVAHLRAAFLRKDALKPLLVPTMLFRSEEYVPNLLDYVWRRLSSQFAIMSIRGAHVAMFAPGNRQDLSAKFVQAVEIARNADRRFRLNPSGPS